MFRLRILGMNTPEHEGYIIWYHKIDVIPIAMYLLLSNNDVKHIIHDLSLLITMQKCTS